MGVKLVWGRQHGVALFGAPMQDSERLRPKRTSQDEATAGTECLSLDFSGPSAAWGRTPAGAGAGARGTWLKLNKHFSARQASHAYH